MNAASFPRDTKSVGDISEVAALHALMFAGYHVAIPFGENNRYDLIIEKEGVLSRVQVKTGRLRAGSIIFNCYSSHVHRSGIECRRYVGEVEFFAVYCPEINEVYLIPATDLDVLQGSLRIYPSRNRQKKGVRLGSRYNISVQIRQSEMPL
jgi:hypothetical protein